MPDKSAKPTDYPRDEIMAMAQAATAGKKAAIYFKYTCAYCGQRCTFAEPNLLYATGECFRCGKVTTIEKAGFMLVVDIEQSSSTAPKKEDNDGTESESSTDPRQGS